MAIAFLSGQTQAALTFDTEPTEGSTNPITSGGVKAALDNKQGKLTFDSKPTASSTNPVTSGGVKTALDKKQNASTAITTSNIGNQTVNYAKFAPNTIVATRAALRNEYFTSAEDTPTTNGIIAWVIG